MHGKLAVDTNTNEVELTSPWVFYRRARDGSQVNLLEILPSSMTHPIVPEKGYVSHNLALTSFVESVRYSVVPSLCHRPGLFITALPLT
jgi:hypothetical protein